VELSSHPPGFNAKHPRQRGANPWFPVFRRLRPGFRPGPIAVQGRHATCRFQCPCI